MVQGGRSTGVKPIFLVDLRVYWHTPSGRQYFLYGLAAKDQFYHQFTTKVGQHQGAKARQSPVDGLAATPALLVAAKQQYGVD